MWGYPRISGDTIRALRHRCREYQRDFCKRFGVSRRTIIRWEENGVEVKWWEKRKADAWKALVAAHPNAFTKAELAALNDRAFR